MSEFPCLKLALPHRVYYIYFVSGYEANNIQLSWINGRTYDFDEFSDVGVTSTLALCFSEEHPYKIACCNTAYLVKHQAHCKVSGSIS